MIHYRCDRCKRDCNCQQDTCYEVHFEARPVVQAEIAFTEEGRDHLLELHELLGDIESREAELLAATQTTTSNQFQLCPECYKQFLQNPLGQNARRLLRFSAN
ncbi:hypothetical protein FF011L_13680 [Roseimaritima multifibrata]|uniref:Uncharacterized protein n=1 Tax=Roseimaritima multifibrata TaxID=1930274 RepID=A0A517MCL6_9BACT|nr:hypothetical protein [Roseimaritima multifibrata]QDS92621.1 hypothetical protein FF011L_13680 [Roseimaritima multifibrata]